MHFAIRRTCTWCEWNKISWNKGKSLASSSFPLFRMATRRATVMRAEKAIISWLVKSAARNTASADGKPIANGMMVVDLASTLCNLPFILAQKIGVLHEATTHSKKWSWHGHSAGWWEIIVVRWQVVNYRLQLINFYPLRYSPGSLTFLLWKWFSSYRVEHN